MTFLKLILLLLIIITNLNANETLMSQWENSKEYKQYIKLIKNADIEPAMKIKNKKLQNLDYSDLDNYILFFKKKYRSKRLQTIKSTLSLENIDLLVRMHKNSDLKNTNKKNKNKFALNLYYFIKHYNTYDTEKVVSYGLRLIKNYPSKGMFLNIKVGNIIRKTLLKNPSIEAINILYFSKNRYAHKTLQYLIEDLYWTKDICKKVKIPMGDVKKGEEYCYKKYILFNKNLSIFLKLYKENKKEESINYMLAMAYSLSYNEDKAIKYFDNLVKLKEIHKLKKGIKYKYLMEDVFYAMINYRETVVIALDIFYKKKLFNSSHLTNLMIKDFFSSLFSHLGALQYAVDIEVSIEKTLIDDHKATNYDLELLTHFLNPANFAIRAEKIINASQYIIQTNCKKIDCRNFKMMNTVYIKNNALDKGAKNITSMSRFLEVSQPISLETSKLIDATLIKKGNKLYFSNKGYKKYNQELQKAINRGKDLVFIINNQAYNKLAKEYIIHSQSYLDSVGAMVYMYNSTYCWNNDKLEILEKKFCSDNNLKIALQYLNSENILDYEMSGLNSLLHIVQNNYPKDIDFNKLLKLSNLVKKYKKEEEILKQKYKKTNVTNKDLSLQLQKQLQKQKDWTNWANSKQNELQQLKNKLSSLNRELSNLKQNRKNYDNKIKELAKYRNKMDKNYFVCLQSNGQSIRSKKLIHGLLCLKHKNN